MKKLITLVLIACGFSLSPITTIHAEEKGKEPMKAMGQYVDDSTITAKIKAKYAEDKTVSAMRVHVETRQGVVVLTGEAKTQIEIEQAEALANEVAGVKAVSNMIVLKAKP